MKNGNDFRLRSLRAVSFRNLNFAATSRRRSADSGPELIESNGARLLDSFFTLHVQQLPLEMPLHQVLDLKSANGGLLDSSPEQLVYVSEVINANSNPNFGSISLPSAINLALGNCIVRVWWKPSDKYSPGHGWKLYCHLRLQLHKLRYVPSSKVDDEYFHDNAILFNLNGRMYTLPECINDDDNNVDVEEPEVAVIKSYSFDTIRTIHNLNRSINELLQSKQRISKQISGLAENWQNYPNYSNTEKYNIPIRNLSKSINKQKTTNDSILSEIVSKKIKINKIKQIIDEDYPIIDKMNRNKLEILHSQIDPIQENLSQLIYPSIISELQQTCLVIREIIVIDNIQATLRYTIMGMEFPLSLRELLDTCYYNKHDLINLVLDHSVEEGETEHERKITQINAGLSYIIQLMKILAEITNSHLKYKMVLAGNSSYIIDFTPTDSNVDKNYYPLFYDHSHVINEGVDYRETNYKKYILKNSKFEMGLNLLNKNLVLLINDITEIYSQYYHDSKETHQLSNNIPIDCLDNFLWNLQYLLLFMTAK